MLDVLKETLLKLPQLQHFHYVEELGPILQIDDALMSVLFGAKRLHHLALGRFTIHNDLYLSRVLPPDCTWALSTINLAEHRLGVDNFQMKTFLRDLLTSARQTVRAITLDVEELEVPSITDARPKNPMFPCLEHVVVKNARMSTNTASTLYSSPKLRSLALSPHDDNFQDDSFHLNFSTSATCLNIFNWGATRASKSRARLDGFIKKNPRITHVNVRPVPGSRITDTVVQDMILAPLAHYNEACVSLSVSAGPGLASAVAFLHLSDMPKLQQVRLEVQSQTPPPVRILHSDVMKQLQSLAHLRCLIIDGHVESRLAPDVWQDQTLDRSQEDDHLATIKDDLLAVAAAYAINFPKLQVLGVEKCWFEIDRSSGVSTIAKAVFEPAIAEKAPYALKASFRVDEHMKV